MVERVKIPVLSPQAQYARTVPSTQMTRAIQWRAALVRDIEKLKKKWNNSKSSRARRRIKANIKANKQMIQEIDRKWDL